MFQQTSYSDQLTFFQKLRSLDYVLLFCIILIGVISGFSMYSTDGGELLYHSRSHIIRLAIFFTMMICFSFFSIRFWHSIGYLFYAIVLGLLIWASLYGITASGSQRWVSLYFINLQPSELMKVAIIIFYAKFYHRMQISHVNNFKNLLIPFAILILPILLVASQPDLGTAILIALSGLVVLWLAGLHVRFFVYSSLAFLVSMPFIVSFLEPYQKLRVLTFFNPERDPLGAGYQIIQSKIAVGSGGLTGKGFLKGTQSYLEFLPEKHTDFVFTLFSEEFGFIGTIFIVFLYSLLILIAFYISIKSIHVFGRILSLGVALNMFLYMIFNMAMVTGLMPVVGIPLPLLSFGGTAMLSIMISFGLLLNVDLHYNYQKIDQ